MKPRTPLREMSKLERLEARQLFDLWQIAHQNGNDVRARFLWPRLVSEHRQQARRGYQEEQFKRWLARRGA